MTGLAAGAVFCAADTGSGLWPLIYLGRVAGTCAAFYALFLCRMLGAGDIKLMAVCVGFLGLHDGSAVLFAGFLLASVPAAVRMIRQGTLGARLWRLSEFVSRSVRGRRFLPYAGREEEQGTLRLCPYLFAGFCLYLAGMNR